MYQVGDVVVHPMHGSGSINGFTTQRIAGRERVYYVFCLPTGGLELLIPIEKARDVGIRDLIGLEQAQELMASFSVLHAERCRNWSKRYRENLERLKSGDLTQVVEVLKALLLRDYLQGLSTGERKMLYMAKQIFITEIAVVTGQTFEDVEKTICQAVRTATKQTR